MTLAILGIDISKAKLHMALLQGNRRPQKQIVTNDAVGFTRLSDWLSPQGVSQIHAYLVATNTYGQAVARALYAQG
jgi:hypothetical protein